MIATILAAMTVSQLAPLNLSVDGEGYVRLARDGRIVYAKQISLVVVDGRIRDRSGASLMPSLAAPAGVRALDAEANGKIYAVIGNDRKALGQVALAIFPAGEILRQEGSFYIAKTRPSMALPGENGAGSFVINGESDIKLVPNTIKPVANAAAISIEIPGKVEIGTARLLLGEFAKIQADDQARKKIESLDFGPAAQAGSVSRVSRARILQRIKEIGIDPNSVRFTSPDMIEISTKSQTISKESIVQAALETATAKIGSAVELKLSGDVAPFVAPVGDVELRVESIATRQELLSIQIGIFVDGKRMNSRVVAFSGQALEIAVKPGDLVKVRLVSNAVAVEVQGRIKKSGRIGDAVEVEVTLGDANSRTVHLGIVKERGLVEVRL